MANKDKLPGYCNHKLENNENRQGTWYCALTENYGRPVEGEEEEDLEDTSFCRYHRSEGPPKNSTNAEKHGIYTKRSNYYNNRDAEEKAEIDLTIQTMLKDAPFGREDYYKFKLLRDIAIDMHKKEGFNNYIDGEGLITETIERDDEGEPIYQDGELQTRAEDNPANLAYDRLSRSIVKQLKDLGLLDDPESQQAEANQSIVEQLSKMNKESENE